MDSVPAGRPYRRDDEDLRGDVLETLMLEGSVPMTVDAQARDGFVTLTGTAQWHYQREAASISSGNAHTERYTCLCSLACRAAASASS